MSEERIQELEQQVQALEARLDAQQTKFNRVIKLLCEDKAEFNMLDAEQEEPVFSRLDEQDERLEEVEDTSARAIVNSRKRTADGGESKTKVEVAEDIARNEIVRRATKKPKQDVVRLKATKIQEMARPQHELAYQTVKDALRNLNQQWRELRVRKDPRELELGLGQVTRELTAVVDEDLADVDATKILISEGQVGRGSA